MFKLMTTLQLNFLKDQVASIQAPEIFKKCRVCGGLTDQSSSPICKDCYDKAMDDLDAYEHGNCKPGRR